MIGKLRAFLAGAMVAWWLRPIWDETRELLAVIGDAEEAYGQSIDALAPGLRGRLRREMLEGSDGDETTPTVDQ